jgi:NHLM bacteriocin system ABC transporter peptidase/ATP-binding protein
MAAGEWLEALGERLRTAWREVSHAGLAPSILQMEATECGAASLGMVLAYYGHWVPLEELRERCGVSRDGTKASNLLRAARSYGLCAKGFRKEPDDLVDLPLPSVIHWNFNHFVVFEGFDRRGRACLNDPAYGTRRVSANELAESFTGVVLAFEPDEGFIERGSPPRVLDALKGQLGHSRDALAQAIVLSAMLVIPSLLAAGFGRIFVDHVLIGNLRGWLAPLLIGMAVTAAVRALIQWLQAERLLRLEVKLIAVFGGRFVWHLLHLPMPFFLQRHAGDLAARVSANDEMAKLLSGKLVLLILSLAVALVFALAMFVVDPLLAAIVVPVTLLNVVALAAMNRSRSEAARRVAKESGQMMSATLGVVRSLETIKASGHETATFQRWLGYHAKMLLAHQELERSSALLGVVPALLMSLGSAAALGVGCLLIVHGSLSAGDLVAFLALSASFSEPVAQLVGLAAGLSQAKASLGRVDDVLAHARDARFAVPASDDAPSDSRLAGALELRDVTFGYNPQDQALIAHFDLSVSPGSRVALVGASGSGKSTLGKLICGIYRPWSGEVLLDGRAIGEISGELLANSLAYVDQDVFLFAGTVRDNLTMWDPGVDESIVTQALKDAGVYDEIAVRPGRQDARVEEGGINFSGGQRQRLEIARALVADPSILVLDEAMAALDPLVERQIDENLRRRGCTCIIIAHRLSTIRDSDQIVMLDAGRVVGRGRHEELLDSCRAYRELVDAQ